jgi:hypothetical protein
MPALLRDPRHSDVSLVAMQPVTVRKFATWVANIAHDAINCDLFRHYGETDCFDPHVMRTDRLCDLIEALADRATQLPGKHLSTRNRAINAA